MSRGLFRVLRKAADNPERQAGVCAHLDQVQVTDLPQEVAGCEECLKAGDRWMHLRMCMTCGKVGCCDSSPNRHASAHFHEEGHPVMRSAQPDENWSWCFVDEAMFVVRRAGDC